MNQKSYLNLKEEVWDRDICSGCGACTAVCPADALYFEKGEVKSPVSNGYCKQETDCVPCGACYAVCPRTEKPEKKLLGEYLKITGVKSVLDIARKQSGGAVTGILINAFEQNLIDAVITVTEDHWTKETKSTIITNSGELVENAGSRYNWQVPLLSSIREAVTERNLKRIAVVGVPCVADAANRMKKSDNDLVVPYGRAIRVIIGLFCTEMFDYHILVQNVLEKQHQIKPWQIKRIDVSGKLEITLNDGSIKNLGFSEVQNAVKSGCHYCYDFSANSSDISAGAVGTPDGYTSLIIRTPEGEGFVESAVANNVIKITDNANIQLIEKLAKKKIQKNS